MSFAFGITAHGTVLREDPDKSLFAVIPQKSVMIQKTSTRNVGGCLRFALKEPPARVP